MEHNIAQIEIQLIEALQTVKNVSDLQNIKAKFLGKQSEIYQMTQQIPTLDIDQRKVIGSTINNYRNTFEKLIAQKAEHIENEILNNKLQVHKIDFTIPWKNSHNKGTQHILTQTMDELSSIMHHIGFQCVFGPEVEDEFHNFTALNVNTLHPARNDTFYLTNNYLLRTQTSSVQIRHMMNNTPPYYIASIGKVYRVDDIDQTHLPMFHQMECLCVDTNITLIDLKNTIEDMLKMYFTTQNLSIRFRASYFPFTTPSMEVDIMYNGKWLELMGCGMVHYKVLENVKVDFKEYQGFAFGVGIERLAMVKHNIADIRYFVENDIRFLRHYG